jgi:hypothetical protein
MNFEQIKRHPFFAGIEWNWESMRRMRAPIPIQVRASSLRRAVRHARRLGRFATPPTRPTLTSSRTSRCPVPSPASLRYAAAARVAFVSGRTRSFALAGRSLRRLDPGPVREEQAQLRQGGYAGGPPHTASAFALVSTLRRTQPISRPARSAWPRTARRTTCEGARNALLGAAAAALASGARLCGYCRRSPAGRRSECANDESRTFIQVYCESPEGSAATMLFALFNTRPWRTRLLVEHAQAQAGDHASGAVLSDVDRGIARHDVVLDDMHHAALRPGGPGHGTHDCALKDGGGVVVHALCAQRTWVPSRTCDQGERENAQRNLGSA